MSSEEHPLSSLYRDKWEGSVVMFGGVDHRYYKGELNWVPLIQAGDWSVHMDRISMKRKVIACSGGCEAVVDTGTSLIEGPRRLVNNIQKLIGATPQGFEDYVSCFAVSTLPSIIFTINGINYPVPARDYILKCLRYAFETWFGKIANAPGQLGQWAKTAEPKCPRACCLHQEKHRIEKPAHCHYRCSPARCK
ncbi:hypothetical protein R6Z07F_017325 [Ovis aries]